MRVAVKGLGLDAAESLQEGPRIGGEVNQAGTSRYGLKPGDVRRAASTFVAGEGAANVYRGGRVYEAVVRGIPEARRDVTDIEQLPIDTPSGGTVPLRRVANVRLASTPSDLKRRQ